MKISVVPLSIVGMFFLIAGCTQSDSNGNDDSERASHIVFDEENELLRADFEKMTVYMDSLYLDHIHDVDVDEAGTIYLAGEKWNHQQVHKFSADGRYTGSIGQLGDDPGSFQKIARLQVSESGLWVSDPELNRITRFNASTGELLESIDLYSLVLASDTLNFDEMMEISPVGLMDHNRMLITVAGKRNPAYQPEWEIQYASIATHKKNTSAFNRLFEERDKRFIVGDYAGRPAAFTLPINEQPLIDFRADGLLYAANSADFYIRVYSKQGTLLRTYNYPYDRHKLNPDEDIFPSYTYNRQLLMVRESADYPPYWPALHHMFLDDEQRLWVSTVTEGREQSEWFVIDDHSKSLITQFRWPVDKPIHRVKNGTAYTIEKNSAGFKVVVSYGITIE